MSRQSAPLEVRFWSNVDVRAPGECWEWRGGKNSNGYGHIKARGKALGAHRLSAALHMGREIRPGLCVRHSCDNPSCVNPSHLIEGTLRENQLDAVERGRNKNTLKTVCPRGHAYSDRSVRSDGHRHCGECRKMRYFEIEKHSRAPRPAASRIERCRDLIGKRVMLVHSPHAVFPKGTRMTVDGTWRGKFTLIIGFASPFFVKDVDRSDFRVIEHDDHGLPCVGCSSRYRVRAERFAQADEACVVCGASK